MSEKSKYIVYFNGYDVYYSNGCFTLDPLPDLSTLQNIVSYLVAEGFVNFDDCL